LRKSDARRAAWVKTSGGISACQTGFERPQDLKYTIPLLFCQVKTRPITPERTVRPLSKKEEPAPGIFLDHGRGISYYLAIAMTKREGSLNDRKEAKP